MQLTQVSGRVTKISEVIKYFNGGLFKSDREKKIQINTCTQYTMYTILLYTPPKG